MENFCFKLIVSNSIIELSFIKLDFYAAETP